MTANFAADMAVLKPYVDSGLVDVVTISEFYDGMVGGRLATSSRQFA